MTVAPIDKQLAKFRGAIVYFYAVQFVFIYSNIYIYYKGIKLEQTLQRLKYSEYWETFSPKNIFIPKNA